MMFPIINAEDWTCPCGRRREVLGEPGKRQLRCVVCEGYGGPFLTKQDRAWLASINVLLAPPRRMQELIEIARQRSLTSDEKRELQILFTRLAQQDVQVLRDEGL